MGMVAAGARAARQRYEPCRGGHANQPRSKDEMLAIAGNARAARTRSRNKLQEEARRNQEEAEECLKREN